MSRSLKVNFILNLTNTISSMLFPLITFPYAARILLADGIGQITFFSSIISYISLFTCIGIPLYAIRETARVRDNPYELSKTTTEILLLHTCLTFLGYIAVFIIAFAVPKIMADVSLFIILSTSILFTTIGCEWFYKGIEDFKYITIRAITVKTASVCLLFLLVQSKEDLLYYAIYTVVGTVGNNVFNFYRLRNYVDIHKINFKDLQCTRHLKPALHIFVLNLVISIYVHLDTVMLGFLQDWKAVGYYTGATRITKMLLSIVYALGTVMIPRLSNLIQNHQIDDFRRLCQKSTEFIFAISLPLFIGLIILSPSLINLLCGLSYTPAILTLEIISPILFFIALSYVMGIQILYPQGKENIVIKCTSIGALINFTLNLLLIPSLAHNGAAIATCVAECSVTTVMILCGRKYIPISYSIHRYINYIVASTVMAIALIMIRLHLHLSAFQHLLLSTFIGIAVYILVLYLRKDTLFVEYIIKPIESKLFNSKMK